MRQFEKFSPALRAAADLDCHCPHGLARMRPCDSSRFAAVQQCISMALAERSRVWPPTAMPGFRAAQSRDDSVVERRARQVGNGPHRPQCHCTSRATGAPSNMFRSWRVEGDASGLGPLARGAALPAKPSTGRSYSAPAAGYPTPVQIEYADLCGLSAPPLIGPAPQARMRGCGALDRASTIARAHSSPHELACEQPTPPVHPADI
eukprot:scaffold2385_cov126-Isochrysis_galbana.AAC.4